MISITKIVNTSGMPTASMPEMTAFHLVGRSDAAMLESFNGLSYEILKFAAILF